MKKNLILIAAVVLVHFACTVPVASPNANNSGFLASLVESKKPKIQVAILLDTSNSMDGLINQAKSQLWKMVNELASSKKGGQAPDIEIALYDYGNTSIEARSGYVRQIVAFTPDLDKVSEKLFELTTNGGDEYCGRVIEEATDALSWTNEAQDLKLIIIAGNEPFTQGPVDFRQACKNAIRKGIMVNTIHCGDYETGVNSGWKEGADLADGKYMNINQDEEVVHIPTPFDAQILKLNETLNSTYIGFGNNGQSNLKRQAMQDVNASAFSEANVVERAVAKSNSNLYKNESWDLVDAAEADEEIIEKIKADELPEEMKNMSVEERKSYIEKKKSERALAQSEIQNLNKKRQAYIEEEMAKRPEAHTLDNVMLEAVRKQAVSKDFKFE